MRSRLNRWIRLGFGVSRREANGMIMIGMIVILIVVVHLLRQHQRSNNQPVANTAHLDSLINVLETNLSTESKSDSVLDHPAEIAIEYFPFDPNTATRADLLALGFSEEISNRIIKYRNSGGRFFQKEDLGKIYGLTDSDYNKVASYIQIPPIETFTEEDNTDETKPEVSRVSENKELILNINTIDSTSLMILNGIGPVLSSRIIRFRSALGGFVDLGQLSEVYGLTDSTFAQIEEYLFIESDFRPKQIAINQLPMDSLTKHPYIDYSKARVITAYRNQHGKFNSLDNLRPIQILDSAWLNKIGPYLEFQ